MELSAEEFAIAITAFLFLGPVAFSFLPGVELPRGSRATYAIGAALFLGTAALLARIENVQYPPFVWLLPLVPLAVIGVLVRDWFKNSRRQPQASATVAEADDAISHVRRESAFPDENNGSALRTARILRERAANPSASPQELASMAYMNPSLRATIAGNPAAPASLLEWLAGVGDSSVIAAINTRDPLPHHLRQPA